MTEIRESNVTLSDLVSEYVGGPPFKRKVEILEKLLNASVSLADVEPLPHTEKNQFLNGMLGALRTKCLSVPQALRAEVDDDFSPALAVNRPRVDTLSPEQNVFPPAQGFRTVGLIDGLDADEISLILKTLHLVNPIIDGFRIRPLQSGFSGAKVFAIAPFIGEERLPYPWIAKIGRTDKMQEEHRNCMQAVGRFPMAEVRFQPKEEKACLLQKLASSVTSWPRPSHQLVWSSSKNDATLKTPDEVCDIFAKFINDYSESSIPTLGSLPLRSYLPKNIRNINAETINSRLRENSIAFNEYSIEIPFAKKGRKDSAISYPGRVYARLIDQNPTLHSYMRFLHGDLHANNLLVDDKNLPWAIDWGCAEFGHYLLDAAYFEISLVMNCVPSGLHPLHVRDLVRSLFGPVSICRDPELVLERLRYCVYKVRQQFLAVSPVKNSFDMDLALFLVSLQQMQYRDLNIWVALWYTHFSLENLQRMWPESVSV